MRGVHLGMEEFWMGDVMQNGGYTIMQTIVVIDLFESVVPGIVWRHRILMSSNKIRKVFAMYLLWMAFISGDFY
jgi:hypothetical protein